MSACSAASTSGQRSIRRWAPSGTDACVLHVERQHNRRPVPPVAGMASFDNDHLAASDDRRTRVGSGERKSGACQGKFPTQGFRMGMDGRNAVRRGFVVLDSRTRGRIVELDSRTDGVGPVYDGCGDLLHSQGKGQVTRHLDDRHDDRSSGRRRIRIGAGTLHRAPTRLLTEALVWNFPQVPCATAGWLRHHRRAQKVRRQPERRGSAPNLPPRGGRGRGSPRHRGEARRWPVAGPIGPRCRSAGRSARGRPRPAPGRSRPPWSGRPARRARPGRARRAEAG